MSNILANKTTEGLKTQIDAWQTVVDDTPGLQWKRVFPPTLNKFLVQKAFGTGDGNGAGAAAGNGIDLTIVPGDVDPAIWGNMTEEAQLEYHRLAGERDAIL
jgi:hypothetical protein